MLAQCVSAGSGKEKGRKPRRGDTLPLNTPPQTFKYYLQRRRADIATGSPRKTAVHPAPITGNLDESRP